MTSLTHYIVSSLYIALAVYFLVCEYNYRQTLHYPNDTQATAKTLKIISLIQRCDSLRLAFALSYFCQQILNIIFRDVWFCKITMSVMGFCELFCFVITAALLYTKYDLFQTLKVATKEGETSYYLPMLCFIILGLGCLCHVLYQVLVECREDSLDGPGFVCTFWLYESLIFSLTCLFGYETYIVVSETLLAPERVKQFIIRLFVASIFVIATDLIFVLWLELLTVNFILNHLFNIISNEFWLDLLLPNVCCDSVQEKEENDLHELDDSEQCVRTVSRLDTEQREWVASITSTGPDSSGALPDNLNNMVRKLPSNSVPLESDQAEDMINLERLSTVHKYSDTTLHSDIVPFPLPNLETMRSLDSATARSIDFNFTSESPSDRLSERSRATFENTEPNPRLPNIKEEPSIISSQIDTATSKKDGFFKIPQDNSTAKRSVSSIAPFRMSLSHLEMTDMTSEIEEGTLHRTSIFREMRTSSIRGSGFNVSISHSEFAEVASEVGGLEDISSNNNNRGSLRLPAQRESLEHSYSFEAFPVAEKRPSFKPIFQGFNLKSFQETLFSSNSSLRGNTQIDAQDKNISSTTSIVTENGEIELFE